MARYFLVTSPGYTATRWLAWALDQHPQVHCTHSASGRALRRPYFRDELQAQVLEKDLARDNAPLGAYLRALPGQGLAATGNVHRFNLTALRRLQQRWPCAASPTVLNLVRHPVPWVSSGTAQMAHMARLKIHEVAQRLQEHYQHNLELYQELGAPADPDLDQQAFAWMCHRTLLLAQDIALPGERHVTMESLTSDPAVLARRSAQLTGLPIRADDPWVARVLRQGRVHAHAEAGPQTPQQRWESWEPWQRHIFQHYTQQSLLFALYRRFGYAPPWGDAAQRSATPDARVEDIKRSYKRYTWPVRSRELPWHRALEPGLGQTLRRLQSHLHDQGLGPWVEARPSLGVSRGARGRVSPLLSGEAWESEGWSCLFYQPRLQDRSPAVSLYHGQSRRRWVINLKGAGQRDARDNFMERSQRCPQFRDAAQRGPHKPLDILIGHPRREWTSHTLVGGALLWPSLMEARYALGWHKLLLWLDGAPADTCIPLRLHLLETLPCPRGGDPRPTWDYFTHPEVMDPLQRAQVWRAGLRVPDLGLTRRELPRWLRRLQGSAWLLPRGPVVYEHITRGKLRVGHLWHQVRHGEDPYALWDALLEVYHGNGLAQPTRPPWEPDNDLKQRFAWLRALFKANREAALSILQRTGQRIGRSLGALHGAGGHGLGRRIRAEPAGHSLDALGLPRRIGAPGGGVCAPRNVTVCGELVDTSHLFNPLFEGSARLEEGWARLGPGRQGAASRRQRRRLQRQDLALARQSVTQLAAVLMGRPELIPAQDAQIEALRAQRKRLEDALDTQPSAATRGEVAVTEARLRALRREHPGYGDNPALRALKDSYRAWARYSHERSRELRPG